MTASLKEVLRNTLEQFGGGDFKSFRRKLHDQDQIRMPWKKLERADRDNTVDLMVQVYSTKDVGDKMLSILEKMNFNQLAAELRGDLENLPGDGGVKVDITAQSLSEGMPQQGAAPAKEKPPKMKKPAAKKPAEMPAAEEKPPKRKKPDATEPAKLPGAAERSANSAVKNKAEKPAAPKNPKKAEKPAAPKNPKKAEMPVAPKKAATQKK